MSFITGKKVLVTGCCGTVGKELVKLLLDPARGQVEALVGIDNHESSLFHLEQAHLDAHHATFFLTDVRDPQAVLQVMEDIDVVFHTAALKHVIMCERSPMEAVQTNIEGVQNIINAAHESKVERVIFTSSDKAVNPTNVMGTSKLMGERLITAANSRSRGDRPVFASTRFGNVLGSSGSVVPIFHEQIRQGGPVTLTHPEMTRFIMSLQQAVELVLRSAEIARGGEVFITKMPVVRIIDIARAMIDALAPRYGHDPASIEIKEIGVKPGEKLYEVLMTDEECRSSVELEDYFSVLPAFRGVYRRINYDYEGLVADQVERTYRSSESEPMGQQAILDFMNASGLLEGSHVEGKPDQRYWPGDKEEARHHARSDSRG